MRRPRRARRNTGLPARLDEAWARVRDALPSALPAQRNELKMLDAAFATELPDVPGSRYAERGASGSRPEAYLRGLLKAAEHALDVPVEPVVRYPASHRTWDASVVGKAKADIKRLVALYRSLYPPEVWRNGSLTLPDDEVMRQWMKAREAFKDAEATWEAFVYEVLLADKEPDKFDYDERELASKAWAFLAEIRPISLFPTQWDYRHEGYGIAPWRLVTDRDKAVRRIQTRGREFVKALEAYIASKGEGITRRPSRETYNIDGVKVVIYNRYRRADEADRVYPFEDYLRELHRQIAPIRKAGFGRALQDLVVEIRFDQNVSKAGHYSHDDTIAIYPWGLDASKAHVLTHEIGHRVYYRLMKPAVQKAWDEAIKARKTHTSAADVDLLGTLLPYDSKEEWAYKFDKDAVLRDIAALPVDDLQKLRLNYLAIQDQLASSKADYLEKLKRYDVGHPLLLEHFSDYGATKPEEAFAEAFDRYVRLGPRALGPWTRAFFEEVVRPARQARDNPRRSRTRRIPRLPR
jgi:hypothetical protein